tara:strand:+ start:273 stop:884 length:612 start_codon:yes stop_codon:yes gene_type:complete
MNEQESFWAEEFGNEYIDRNKSAKLLASNLNFFARCLSKIENPSSVIEFGANIGMNLKALRLLFPELSTLKGLEINKTASARLAELIGEENVINSSIVEYDNEQKFDLSLIKGVLIHCNPDQLQDIYKKLYMASSKYILIAEYYNPEPVSISYRGYENKLFKRDFAGEILDKFSDLRLIDYGFCYHRGSFPQDDITWFLLEKN